MKRIPVDFDLIDSNGHVCLTPPGAVRAIKEQGYLMNGERVLLIGERDGGLVTVEANVFETASTPAGWRAVQFSVFGRTIAKDYDPYPEDVTIAPWPAGGWKVTVSVQENEKQVSNQSIVLRHPDSLEKLQDAVNLAMVKAPDGSGD